MLCPPSVQCLQIKHQCFLGKRECTQLCCIVHSKTFHEELGMVSSISTHERSLFFPILDFATALALIDRQCLPPGIGLRSCLLPHHIMLLHAYSAGPIPGSNGRGLIGKKDAVFD